MPTFLLMALAALSWADPPAASPSLSAQQIVAAMETVLGDAIARAEPSVVAIAREKSENDETLAIRGRDAGRNLVIERRMGLGLTNIDPFAVDAMSFDYGSGVVIGDRGEILTAYHVV